MLCLFSGFRSLAQEDNDSTWYYANQLNDHAVSDLVGLVKVGEAHIAATTYSLDIRIGIQSVALIAGIVDVKKFAFDIWGNTVNAAACMELNAAPGKLNISEVRNY